jgi:FkbM family methyltransferase
MIKAIYLKLLNFRPARLLLRRWRSRLQELSGYSDPFFDLARVARASRATLFLDIGCHKGETLLRFLESGIDCPVAAFDPVPESLESARRLLKGHPQISFYPLALSDEDGEADFHLNTNEQTSSLLANDSGNVESFPQDTCGVTERKVITSRLDSWATDKKVKSYVVIKCDTQGAEGKVVRGGISFIRDHAAAFYGEVMLGNMYRGQTSFGELSTLLESECGMVLQDIYPCLHDPKGRAVQFDALWVKPQFLQRR